MALLLDIFVKRVMKIKLTGATYWKCIKLFPDALFYLIVLLIEIIKANISITKLVLAQNISLEPCIIKFNSSLKTTAARIALANSITLTPGTITVSLEGNEFLVHALNHEIASGVQGSMFEKILSRMERRIDA